MGELLETVGVRGESSGLAAELDLMSAAVDPELVERAVRTVNTLVRDPAFSRKVRSAYGETCAICAIAPRLDGKLFGLEAAHIRWANHGGPDEVRNGVLLCRMHHHALDRGAIRIDASMRVAISPKLARDSESDALFARFEGKEIRLPARSTDQPHPTMIDWHWNQVFKR
jgi:putative restriction endonuclease